VDALGFESGGNKNKLLEKETMDAETPEEQRDLSINLPKEFI